MLPREINHNQKVNYTNKVRGCGFANQHAGSRQNGELYYTNTNSLSNHIIL